MIDLIAPHRSNAVALVDADTGVETTYGELQQRVAECAEHVRREVGRGLVFHAATNTADSIVLYLASLDAGCPVVLLPSGDYDALLATYTPDVFLLPKENPLPGGSGGTTLSAAPTYQAVIRTTARSDLTLHPDLALLLTTSGSTGSPKLVRLTRSNLLANARSIVAYLGLHAGERSMQSLPMHYSYGLSLINSHLATGATVVLTQHSFLRHEFWEAFDRERCTSFAGVPYSYETLHRLRFDPARHPTLRTMTQAGGGLRHELIRDFHERTHAAGVRFFVMYGQTEATARISYVPHERLGEKIGSIGVPIPGGSLSLAALPDSEQQELVYHGPNVMMGYAESAQDLAAGDELQGSLRTGDLATADEDGYYYLTGRLKRFAKLFGKRINLEDVEREIERDYPVQVAATDHGGGLMIYTAADDAVDLAAIGRELARKFNVPPKFIVMTPVTAIPLTASGKKDYKALTS